MNQTRTCQYRPYSNRRVICRFSCGAASAVATKLALKKYPDAVIYRNDTGSEHPDNERFMADCERWFGKPVNVIKSKKYQNIFEVFDKYKFLSSPRGAPCTAEMKRIPGDEIWRVGDIEIFGYTVEEQSRVARFKKHNNERIIECPLIDSGLTKADCLGILDRAGIEIPVMYKLGFRNNNCIGCVKARDSIDYWKRVRKHFPEVFDWYASKERELNTTLNRVTTNGERQPIFLDQIEDGEPTGTGPDIQCGLFCMAESEGLAP